MIAIIGAMDCEIEILLERFEPKSTVTFADKTLYLGVLGKHNVIIAKSGIGKVNAAMTTAYILSHYQIDFLVNIGVAGGIQGVQIGELLLAEGITYFDVSLNGIDDLPFGKLGDDPLIVYPDPHLRNQAKQLLEKKRITFKEGLIASGDSFITKRSQIEAISEVVPDIKACEMEGMAIGMCCHKLGVPFLSVRGISDLIHEPNQKITYQLSMKEVAQATAGFAISFLEELN